MKKISAFTIVGILLVLSVLFSVSVGSVNIPLGDILRGIMEKETGSIGIIRTIRVPRVIMGILVGANLSVAGVLLQGVMRNPLADPGITGISSGASVVVMLIMLYFPASAHMIPLYGFLGGMLACIMIYSLAWKSGITAVRIILAGVAVNAILGGISSMISILNSENLAGVLTWMNGNLGKKSWNEVRLMAVYTAVGLALAIPMAKSCNLLALGDKNAKSLGINPNLHRIMISVVAVFLAGISTSFAGVIGFVGLVVPHVARLLMGSDHKILIPFSAVLGSFVLVVADTIGRTVAAPYEIPVGVIMSVLGGPFFLYLLRKGGDSYGS
jgi:iron complex transport system permease protein